MCGPTALEAEEGDRSVMGDVFRMIHHESYKSSDDALALVCKGNMLRHTCLPNRG